jgi:hypothetical protein
VLNEARGGAAAVDPNLPAPIPGEEIFDPHPW